MACAPIESTNDRVRRRRLEFGEYLLPVSVLVDHAGQFVLVRHARDPLPGGWTLPGGYPERGESLERAAVRETREECGLDIELGPPVGVVAARVTSPSAGEMEYDLTIFRGRSRGGIPEVHDRVEIDDALLVPFEEIEELAAARRFPSIHPNLDPAIMECLRLAVRR